MPTYDHDHRDESDSALTFTRIVDVDRASGMPLSTENMTINVTDKRDPEAELRTEKTINVTEVETLECDRCGRQMTVELELNGERISADLCRAMLDEAGMKVFCPDCQQSDEVKANWIPQ